MKHNNSAARTQYPSARKTPDTDALVALGFSIFPVTPPCRDTTADVTKRGKKPYVAWTPYQTRRATADELADWKTKYSDANYAVVTGTVSGVVVLDLDDEVAAAPFLEHHGGLPPTPAVRTGKGLHYYFQCPDFPTKNGVRMSILGDMAQVLEDGTIVVLGRGSQCINTGGEKVFPEEVEQALKAHPAVYDALVAAAPDERFGQKVAAVVSIREGHEVPSLEDVQAACRKTIAGYKAPRSVVVVPEIRRSPSGKADYRWAKEQVEVV